MKQARKWTTPTLTFTLRDKETKEPLTDLVFDFLVITLSTRGLIIEKEISFEDYNKETAQFTIKLTQEETGQLTSSLSVECEANIMIGQDRVASDLATFQVAKNLHCGVINNE